ncbi:TcpE family conjugal transfer membrane protein [Priestia megaterium]
MEREQNFQTTKMYVVTNVTKINRKIYSIFRINIGRALPLQSLLYFLATFGIVLILRHIPILNYLFLWIPFTVAYVGLPMAAAYLLGGIVSEDRTPLALFRSFLSYHLRQRRNTNYFRGKEVQKPIVYKFKGMPTYQLPSEEEVYPNKRLKFKGVMSYQSFNK